MVGTRSTGPSTLNFENWLGVTYQAAVHAEYTPAFRPTEIKKHMRLVDYACMSNPAWDLN